MQEADHADNDMEGLAGAYTWERCCDPADDSPAYMFGRDDDAHEEINGLGDL